MEENIYFTSIINLPLSVKASIYLLKGESQLFNLNTNRMIDHCEFTFSCLIGSDPQLVKVRFLNTLLCQQRAWQIKQKPITDTCWFGEGMFVFLTACEPKFYLMIVWHLKEHFNEQTAYKNHFSCIFLPKQGLWNSTAVLSFRFMLHWRVSGTYSASSFVPIQEIAYFLRSPASSISVNPGKISLRCSTISLFGINALRESTGSKIYKTLL